MAKSSTELSEQRRAYRGLEAEILGLHSAFETPDPHSPYAAHAIRLSSVAGLVHGFFGRLGGESVGTKAHLNMSYHVGDDRTSVANNRRTLQDFLNQNESPTARLVTVRQTHSVNIIHVENKDTASYASYEADAMATNLPDLHLTVLTADCAPLLFCDPDSKTIAACHAGWRGALNGIIEKTVNKMQDIGARTDRIMAAIGPMIHQPSYHVGDDMRDKVLEVSPNSHYLFDETTPDTKGGRWLFDFPSYIVQRLRAAGVSNIERLHIDTVTDDRFFSSRESQRLHQDPGGRQASVIGWKTSS